MWQKKSNKVGEPADLTVADLKRKAVELLARREYSYAELEKKLLPLTQNEENAYTALEWLLEHGLQNDERFACSYVRSKALSGYGPIRIRMELNQKGVAAKWVNAAFEECEQEVNWPQLVDQLIEKKGRTLDMTNPKDKNKLLGYLQRRGFNLDQIYAGLDRYQNQ